MSQPEHMPQVAVDFAPPSRSRRGTRRLVVVIVVTLMLGALFVAVTQLLLR